MSVRRLILFDIDGTLVAGGPAKDAFLEAMLETFGTTGDAEGITFAGKTDPQIARELLSAAGLEHGAIDAGFAALWPRYLGYLEEKLLTRPMRVLPGVRPLLEELSSREDIGVGLLTGNIEGGARLKLASADLWEHFRVGSYGSDHELRDELPGIALGRACEIWGTDLEAKSAVVVGDTPRDVACGRSGGARTFGVATGHYGSDELWAAGADHVLDDLVATSEVVAWLVS